MKAFSFFLFSPMSNHIRDPRIYGRLVQQQRVMSDDNGDYDANKRVAYVENHNLRLQNGIEQLQREVQYLKREKDDLEQQVATLTTRLAQSEDARAKLLCPPKPPPAPGED
jgi:hypothetical protein